MNSEHEQFAAYFEARHDKVRRTAYLLCGAIEGPTLARLNPSR